MVVGGNAIIKFADIFADFGVALDEMHKLVYTGRCTEKAVDINGGEDMFPGQREEGVGDKGACSHGGETFIILGEAVDDEPVYVKRDNRWLFVRHK